MTDFKKDAGSEAPENSFAADFETFFAEEEARRAAQKREDWLIPWSIEERDEDEKERWAVFRPGESSANGDQPFGVFAKKRNAELYANVLFPVSSREPRFSLGLEAGEHGYPIYEKGKDEPVGYMAEPDQEWIMRLNIGVALATSPSAMSSVFADGGARLAEHVGEVSFAKSLWLEKSKKEE